MGSGKGGNGCIFKLSTWGNRGERRGGEEMRIEKRVKKIKNKIKNKMGK